MQFIRFSNLLAGFSRACLHLYVLFGLVCQYCCLLCSSLMFGAHFFLKTFPWSLSCLLLSFSQDVFHGYLVLKFLRVILAWWILCFAFLFLTFLTSWNFFPASFSDILTQKCLIPSLPAPLILAASTSVAHFLAYLLHSYTIHSIVLYIAVVLSFFALVEVLGSGVVCARRIFLSLCPDHLLSLQGCYTFWNHIFLFKSFFLTSLANARNLWLFYFFPFSNKLAWFSLLYYHTAFIFSHSDIDYCLFVFKCHLGIHALWCSMLVFVLKHQVYLCLWVFCLVLESLSCFKCALKAVQNLRRQCCSLRQQWGSSPHAAALNSLQVLPICVGYMPKNGKSDVKFLELSVYHFSQGVEFFLKA